MVSLLSWWRVVPLLQELVDSLEGGFLADLTGSLVSGLVCSLGVYSFAWAGQIRTKF